MSRTSKVVKWAKEGKTVHYAYATKVLKCSEAKMLFIMAFAHFCGLVTAKIDGRKIHLAA